MITAPMPSMPVGFWGDDDGSRYRAAYFDDYPGAWRHGDWITITDRGSCVITGRSDATLNRGGVRLGTSEFYSVVEGLDGVADSLVVHLEDADGGPGQLVLFVVTAGGGPLDDEAVATMRSDAAHDVVAPARARRDPPTAVDPSDTLRQEVGGSREAHPVGRITRRRRQPRRPRRPHRPRCRRGHCSIEERVVTDAGGRPIIRVGRPDESAPADEMTMLRGWLDHLRKSAVSKIEGVDEEQMRWKPAPTANSLGVIVVHLGYAERFWFRVVCAAEEALSRPADMFLLPDEWTVAEAVAFYRAEWAAADVVLDAATSLDQVAAATARPTTYRWALTHMIEETARHVGHMDITRELLDGHIGR